MYAQTIVNPASLETTLLQLCTTQLKGGKTKKIYFCTKGALITMHPLAGEVALLPALYLKFDLFCAFGLHTPSRPQKNWLCQHGGMKG